MLISIKKRFIFVANSKAASTSIELALSPYAEIQRGITPKDKHMKMQAVLNEFGFLFEQPEYDPNTFVKFGVMRDPVDWIYSWFRYRKGNNTKSPLPKNMTFPEFWAKGDWNLYYPGGKKRQQQNTFTSPDGDILVDYIIPYNMLSHDFEMICQSLGVNTKLTIKNPSKIKALDDDIDDDLRAEIQEFYAEDYALYNRIPDINAQVDLKAMSMTNRRRQKVAKRQVRNVRNHVTERQSRVTNTAQKRPSMHPDYFFLFTINNSGSTIMSQYLASQIDGYLPENMANEGLNIPEVAEHIKQNQSKYPIQRGRWSQKVPHNWPFIHSVWDNYRDENVFVEASPPNLVRIPAIRAEFEGCAKYITSLCNPYQQIASSIYNYSKGNTKRLEEITKRWLKLAGILKSTSEQFTDMPHLSYEEFCADPSKMNKLLDLGPVRQAKIRGKYNTQIQDIRLLSARTTSFLNAQELDRINCVLESDANLVEHFGYQVMSGSDLLASFAGQDEDVQAGLKRRDIWNRNSGKLKGKNSIST